MPLLGRRELFPVPQSGLAIPRSERLKAEVAHALLEKCATSSLISSLLFSLTLRPQVPERGCSLSLDCRMNEWRSRASAGPRCPFNVSKKQSLVTGSPWVLRVSAVAAQPIEKPDSSVASLVISWWHHIWRLIFKLPAPWETVSSIWPRFC